MNILTYDYETCYGANLPWIPKSYPVSLCAKFGDEIKTWVFNHSEATFVVPDIDEIQTFFNQADILIAHNHKFELHWNRAIGLDVSKHFLYCTMVAEYLLAGQDKRTDLSLAGLSTYYNLPNKIDKVKEWWDSGYETYDIPLSTLIPYGEQDVLNCEAIYKQQVHRIHKAKLHQLVKLRCESLRVTEEIEWNGMMIDTVMCSDYSKDCASEIVSINEQLMTTIKETLIELQDIPLNFNSNDVLSAILFGGKIKYAGREPGKREGTTRKCDLYVETTGLGFKPREGTETAKQGYYQTDVSQLSELKAKTPNQKLFIELISKLSKLEKMKGTYYDGLLDKQIDTLVHPTINECVTATGRYSSSNPNAQNIPRGSTSPVKEIFVTRYKE